MRTMPSLAAVLLAALSLAACGGDDDSGGGDKPAQTGGTDKPGQTAGGAGGAACIESWNAKASPDVKGYTVAGVSERDTMAGTYKGKEFEASTEADPVTVKPGDCVVAQVTTTETEYVFVESAPTAGGPKAWHNLEEDGTPLAKPGAAQLEGIETAKLQGYGPEGKLEPNE